MPEIPSIFARIERTVPVVSKSDSETHWTCRQAPERSQTHHMMFPRNICRYCKTSAPVLRARQARLLTVIHDVAGGRFAAYQITSWSRSTRGVYLVYYADASDNEHRTEVSVSEVLRALEAVQ